MFQICYDSAEVSLLADWSQKSHFTLKVSLDNEQREMFTFEPADPFVRVLYDVNKGGLIIDDNLDNKRTVSGIRVSTIIFMFLNVKSICMSISGEEIFNALAMISNL